MDHKIRLLLIDDHSLFRESLARLLEAESGIELAGTFSSAEEALASVASRSVDVVLLDFDLGEGHGLHFLDASRERGYRGKVLMVTAGMSNADTLRALEGGASGVFLKHSPPAELITAIHKVADGQTWLDAGTVQFLVGAALDKSKTATATALNKREQEVLKGVFEGLTNKEIAAHLEISVSYVKAVLQQLFDKTGVRSRAQLVRIALEKHIEYGLDLEY
jgi:DNA-binding NarL/FixJ family response regulator